MENNKIQTRLSLKKEIVTKLNSDSLKNIMGGFLDPPPDWSCITNSCTISSAVKGSCGAQSCVCLGEDPQRPQ